MNQAAACGPPGDSISKPTQGPAVVSIKGRIHFDHKVRGDRGHEGRCKRSRREAEIIEEKVGPLISGVCVADRFEIDEENISRTSERRLGNIRKGRPGGQLGRQSGGIGGQIFLRG